MFMEVPQGWSHWWHNRFTDSQSFKFRTRIKGRTPSSGNTRNIEIAMSLKYISNFRRTLENPLINCAVSLQLIWPANSVITDSTGAATIVGYAGYYLPERNEIL